MDRALMFSGQKVLELWNRSGKFLSLIFWGSAIEEGGSAFRLQVLAVFLLAVGLLGPASLCSEFLLQVAQG